jgi:regulation of enolase protein 1 (concanavalin A-like superfamily)
MRSKDSREVAIFIALFLFMAALFGAIVIALLIPKYLGRANESAPTPVATAQAENPIATPSPSPVPPAATAAPSDNLIPFFDSASPGQLDPRWLWLPGSSPVSAIQPGSDLYELTILAGADTDQWQQNNTAPLLTLPVEGSFSAVVRVAFSPVVTVQHAGIGLRSSEQDDSWIRITRTYHEQIDGFNGVFLMENRQGTSERLASAPFTETSFFLRIDRMETSAAFFYSSDGISWVPLGEGRPIPFTGPLEIYLVVYSTDDEQTAQAVFRELSITALP